MFFNEFAEQKALVIACTDCSLRAKLFNQSRVELKSKILENARKG